MKRIVFLLLGVVSLFLSFTSCTSDHDHYYEGVPLNSGYYYHNGYYYADPDFVYQYPHDANHYYYGRLEWKGATFGWAIVLRENPYYGLVLRVENPLRVEECLGRPNLRDGEVMVRFAFTHLDPYYYDGVNYPFAFVDHIYYTHR